MAMRKISVTDIGDFKLGNAENSEKGTGCTVIICEEGAVGGVDVRGGGPATRETDLLRSENTVNSVNAVVLSGGSAFGLEAASGVMRELAEKNIGFSVGDGVVVPIVCGASLYDLPVGDNKAFPDVYMGAQAVRNAYTASFINGNHGAGTGATVGKMQGYERAMKTGLGTFACGDGVVEVGAIAAVNAVGDVYNGAGNIIAGLRAEDGRSIFGTIKTLKGMIHDKIRAVDDGTSFINRSEIDEALAAAAKQYEEEKTATAAPVQPAAAEEPEVIQTSPEAEPVEEAVELVFQEPSEETVPETAEPEPVVFEEIPETAAEEVPAAEPLEEPVPEEVAEEAVISEEPAEEPAIEIIDDATIEEYLEPEPAVSEEIPEEEAPEEFAEEEPEAEAPEEAVEPEVFEEIPEPVIEDTPAEEPAAEFIPEPEAAAEPVAVFAPEPEVPAVEEQAAEASEEFIPETVTEEAAEEEEPVVLNRADMGYDIVFNTTISCLITNAALTKSQANKLASILHDAYARAIKPVHGTLDGDTVFVLASGKQQVNFDAFAALATDVMQYAIIDGALSAEGAYGLPSARDMQKPEK